MRTFLSRGPVAGALLCVAVVVGSAVAILWLQSYAANRERARASLSALSAQTAVIRQLEWQAVAERAVSAEVSERMEVSRTRARAALADTIDQLGPNEGVAAVGRDLERYLAATRAQLALLAKGDLESAERIDEEIVDPTYERLRARIEAVQAQAGREAARATTLATAGILLVLAGGLGAVAGLFWRLASASRAAREAFFDPLTGLANRMLLTDRLTHALALADRTQERVAVLFLDLDDFKRVNDTLGHAAGDALLRSVGDRLAQAARASDTAGRLGGDEFALVLHGDVDAASALDAAARLSAELAEPFAIGGHHITMTASVGCAVSEPGGSSSDELLRNADLAMYAGKQQGKHCVVVYEPSMYEALSDRLQLETDLRHALARDEISVVYQPVVEVETGRLRSLEALARWTHPVRGFVGPALFIPLAEESGMIQEIGRFVLREAIEQLKAWQGSRVAIPPIGIAVNVSPVQLEDGQIVTDVRDALSESGLDPAMLTLEITEAVLIKRGAAFRKTLVELHELGVKLAVDHFGTGYSSLASLASFPIDTVKIDRAFVARMSDERGVELVSSIIEFGRVLGLDSVAEGIETIGQAEALGQLECTYGQGSHYAAPLSPEAAYAFLEAHSTAAGSGPADDQVAPPRLGTAPATAG